jgi:hypothetical protein
VTEIHDVASNQFLTIVEPNLKVAGISPPGVQLRLAGRVGSRYDLSSSPDLVNWAHWRSVTSTGPVLIITDTNVSGVPRRFYRSVQP